MCMTPSSVSPSISKMSINSGYSSPARDHHPPPGNHAITAQGEPQPFRAAATGRQVSTDLVVEDVGQAVEQLQLITPGDRAQGEVMLMQNQGILRLEAPCPLRDQLSWLRREDTSAGCVAYMAHPSFLVAPATTLIGASRYPQPTNLVGKVPWASALASGPVCA